MRRNKIKADNVDELMEIVKAVQRGEEPTQDSIRRKAESVPEAHSPKSNVRKSEEWDDENEFLTSDDTEEEEEPDSPGLMERFRQWRAGRTTRESKTDIEESVEESTEEAVEETAEKSSLTENLRGAFRTEEPDDDEKAESDEEFPDEEFSVLPKQHTQKKESKEKRAENESPESAEGKDPDTEEEKGRPERNKAGLFDTFRTYAGRLSQQRENRKNQTGKPDDDEGWVEDSFEDSLNPRTSGHQKNGSQAINADRTAGEVSDAAVEIPIDRDLKDLSEENWETPINYTESIRAAETVRKAVEAEESAETVRTAAEAGESAETIKTAAEAGESAETVKTAAKAEESAETVKTAEAAKAAKPTKAEEPVKTEEAADTEKTAQAEALAETEESADSEEPVKTGDSAKTAGNDLFAKARSVLGSIHRQERTTEKTKRSKEGTDSGHFPERDESGAAHAGNRTGLLRRDSILNRSEYDEEERSTEDRDPDLDPQSRDVFERLAGGVKSGQESGGAQTGAVSGEKESEAAGQDSAGTSGAPSGELSREISAETSSNASEKSSEENSAETSGQVSEEDAEKTSGQTSAKAEQPDAGTKPRRRRRMTAAEKEEEIRKGFALQRRTFSDYLALVKESIAGLPSRLREKGITNREMGMIGIAAVFAVLVIILGSRLIAGSISDKKKSENVTADEGLKVTVEDEPESWTNSYPVQLKFSVSGETIQTIRIDGEEYTPDDKGIVTVETGNDRLSAEVETDQGTKSAQIVISMLDQDAPIVRASLKSGKIELSAVDSRSSVRGLYYAEYQPNMLNQLPEYVTYTEPFDYTEGMTYLYYADDAAGNSSIPVATTMETADSLVLAENEISLFPGETEDLQVSASPEGAVLNNLQFESMNPEFFSVDSSGRITALAVGTGAVKVTADGLDDVICTVNVTESRTVKISAIGDCTLGTDSSFNTTTNFTAYYTVNGASYFFQNVKSILEEDDATFANFEGTLTDSETRADKEYAFKGDPSYTEILKNGSVEVVTLANNHSSDYGSESLTDTEQAMTDAGIDYCIGDTIAYREANGVRTAYIGIYVLDDGMAREQQVIDTIAKAKANGASIIIMGFHWGSEKATEPDSTQQSLAHTAIDNGADLVVGHHPHVLQGIEKYNGKYIAYSLGNFCFGGNSAPSDLDTMIFQQTFTVTQDGVGTEDEVSIIPCSISSEAGYNNYQPTPAEGEEASRIIARLNELSAPYGVSIAEDGTVTAAGENSAADSTDDNVSKDAADSENPSDVQEETETQGAEIEGSYAAGTV